MSASNRSVLPCRSLLADPSITSSERMKAASMLWRLVASTKRGKPRGWPFAKRPAKKENDSRHLLESILSEIQ